MAAVNGISTESTIAIPSTETGISASEAPTTKADSNSDDIAVAAEDETTQIPIVVSSTDDTVKQTTSIG